MGAKEPSRLHDRTCTDITCLAFLAITIIAFVLVLVLSTTNCSSIGMLANVSAANAFLANASSVDAPNSTTCEPNALDPFEWTTASILCGLVAPLVISVVLFVVNFLFVKLVRWWCRLLLLLVVPIAPIVTFTLARGSTETAPSVVHILTLGISLYLMAWWLLSRKKGAIVAAIYVESTTFYLRGGATLYVLGLSVLSAALQALLVAFSLGALGDVIGGGEYRASRLLGLVFLPLILASFVYQLFVHVNAFRVYGEFFFRHSSEDSEELGARLGFGRAFRTICMYHLGSVFFAALVLRVASTLRAWVGILERETRAAQTQWFLLKLCYKLVNCVLYATDKTVKFVSDYSAVFVAAQGSSFCMGSYKSFFFFLGNPAQVAIQQMASTECEYVTSLVLAVACSLLYTASAEAHSSPSATAYAILSVFVVAYTIFRATTSIPNSTITTISVCCFQDKAEFDSRYTSERLAMVFGMRRRGDGKSVEEGLDEIAEEENRTGGGGWQIGGGGGSEAKDSGSSKATDSGGSKAKDSGGWRARMPAPVAPQAPQGSAETCHFWFVKADELRRAHQEGDTAIIASLSQPLQALLRFDKDRTSGRPPHPERLLQRQEIDRRKAYSGEYQWTHAAVSHRWENSDEPDPTRTQQQMIIAFLLENPSIKFLWLDYWCMPQGRRTAKEKEEFGVMLPNINMLYLGMKVLILLDLSYLSRFWTQFEAWLSFQNGSVSGLAPAEGEHAKRYHIVPIHGAAANPKLESFMREGLVIMWSRQTPQEAFAHLSLPDVFVTNQKDKEVQLPKILMLNEEVKRLLSGDGDDDGSPRIQSL